MSRVCSGASGRGLGLRNSHCTGTQGGRVPQAQPGPKRGHSALRLPSDRQLSAHRAALAGRQAPALPAMGLVGKRPGRDPAGAVGQAPELPWVWRGRRLVASGSARCRPGPPLPPGPHSHLEHAPWLAWPRLPWGLGGSAHLGRCWGRRAPLPAGQARSLWLQRAILIAAGPGARWHHRASSLPCPAAPGLALAQGRCLWERKEGARPWRCRGRCSGLSHRCPSCPGSCRAVLSSGPPSVRKQ